MSSWMISNAFKGCGLEKFWHSGKQQSGYEDHVLVLIQLEGGNDGLNTVIPLDQYSNLIKARKNILIPDKKVLDLNNSSITGLHPALGELQKLYNDKQLTIIQGVSCSNPNLSHFKAIDIWHSGSDSTSDVSTGWLGRFLDQYSVNHAENNISDPLAIQIGWTVSKALQGATANDGIVVRDLNSFYDLAPGHYETVSDAHNNKLSFLRKMVVESKEYLIKVKVAASRQNNLSKRYPPSGNNLLAEQLKIVARLIGGGLQTKVYIVNLGGFDTHASQVDSSDPAKGAHTALLAQLSEAIAAFQDDLFLMGKQDNVLSMIYSEFGRRIKSNSGFGSDHGTSAPVMLFGSKIKGGLIGNNPEIPSKVTVNDNVPLQNDFRSVYASVLKSWFGASESAVNSILLGSYPTLNLI